MLGRTAVILGFQLYMVGIALLSFAAGGGSRGDEPGSDDGGPGRRRPDPPPPSPAPHVSWPDFERQFAEHVEAMRTRDRVAAG